MKKLNFMFDAHKMTKEQMKNVVGGVGTGGGGGGGGTCTLVCYMYEGIELGTISPVGCDPADDDSELFLTACSQFWPNDAESGRCEC